MFNQSKIQSCFYKDIFLDGRRLNYMRCTVCFSSKSGWKALREGNRLGVMESSHLHQKIQFLNKKLKHGWTIDCNPSRFQARRQRCDMSKTFCYMWSRWWTICLSWYAGTQFFSTVLVWQILCKSVLISVWEEGHGQKHKVYLGRYAIMWLSFVKEPQDSELIRVTSQECHHEPSSLGRKWTQISRWLESTSEKLYCDDIFAKYC